MKVQIEPLYVDLGRRIHVLRAERGWTQEQLGKQLNPPVTRASIANIEMGKQRLLVHTLVQITDILKLKLQDLLPDKNHETDQTIGTDQSVRDELKEKLGLPERKIEKLTQQFHPLQTRGRK
jgi:transcriptional regulator with XRE-family HTH domain